ncbi:MAG: hypothetical protein RIK87_06675 [Fuerstiella sp.]
MNIDWFTFAAQILNFLVLIWLLKRFLYGPIINAINEREAGIADRLNQATAARQAAAEREQHFLQKTEELANAREQLLADAHREVQTWKAEHLQNARAEVDQARRGWQNTLAREKQTLLRELQLDAAHHATDMARHVLTELADEPLQNRLVTRFLKLLADMDAATQRALRAAHPEPGLFLESSHVLSAAERERIEREVRRLVEADVSVEFRENDQLICGIELQAPGCKLAWSVRELMAELESDLIDAIDVAVPSDSAGGGPGRAAVAQKEFSA